MSHTQQRLRVAHTEGARHAQRPTFSFAHSYTRTATKYYSPRRTGGHPAKQVQPAQHKHHPLRLTHSLDPRTLLPYLCPHAWAEASHSYAPHTRTAYVRPSACTRAMEGAGPKPPNARLAV